MTNIWRFHDNGYGEGKGLNDGGMETFKDHPHSALAREICQNSIDARKDKSKPAHVVFRTFDIEKNKLENFSRLEEEINKCYEFRKNNEGEAKQLKVMRDYIKKTIFHCLRISDFNTTGLLGVSNDALDRPFNNLTKGSGICGKTGSTGGSKGIGKFAAFCASIINTVYYSTLTSENECGSIGVSRLRSAPVNKSNPKLLSTGIGYFASDETNAPIPEQLILDRSFNREDSGTDVFIIGYNDKEDWVNIITAEILNSFMIAILEKNLTVQVEDVLIKSTTVTDIISNLENTKIGARLFRDIKSQYELYTGNESTNVFSEIIDINGSEIKVFVKKYKQQENAEASKRCIFVRYPYMKILHKTGYSCIPYSAMVVISDNELNKRLRDIENPQHTGWFLERLDDYPQEKKKTRALKKLLEDQAKNFVQSVLSQSNGTYTDVEGVGEYLPSFEDEGNMDAMVVVTEGLVTTRVVKVGQADPNFNNGDDDVGEGLDPSIGGGEGEDPTPLPGSEDTPPTPPGPNPPIVNPSQGTETEGEDGKNPTYKKVRVNGIRFRNIVKDKDKGCYDIIFVSTTTDPYCEICINELGESGDKYPLTIESASINGQDYLVENNTIKNISVIEDKRYVISYKTTKKELFSCEVILNAYRK
ncbi:MAG: hypothetical protein Q4C49_13830 [Bacillota bacterium]|nr:hypothetical protein [Bacillota bacterium]